MNVPTLKGKKVILRKIRMSDAPRFVRWLSDPEVNKFLRKRSGVTLKKEREWVRGLAKKKNNCHFAIDTKEGAHIGTVSLHGVSKQDKCTTLGIFIGEKAYWNRGYGMDAMKTVLDYGFKKLKLHRIDLGVIEYNPRAIALYKKLGFRVEGRVRERTLYCGKFYDEFTMGMLDREWAKKRKTL